MGKDPDITEREIDAIVDNEREWRRFMVKGIRDLEKEQSLLKAEFAAFKVWLWIGRFIVVSSIGGVYAWVKSRIP